jgi:hypothetical protein
VSLFSFLFPVALCVKCLSSMAPRSVTRSARPPDTMHHGRLENEESLLLPDEEQCSDDHGHGTTQKVKTFRDPSVGFTLRYLLLVFLYDLPYRLHRGCFLR